MRDKRLLVDFIGDPQGRVCHHATLIGEDFPRHLQIAFGRAVFRLLHGAGRHRSGFGRTAYGLTDGLVYLRDLPLNLASLARLGHGWAMGAYLAECERSGQKSCFAS